MIITDRFVYIHQPKTGGTFVSSVFRRLYKVKDGTAYESRYGMYGRRRKHWPCWRIPEAHRSKKVLAAFRNPYDLYVSLYEYGWWKKEEFRYEYESLPGFRQRFPDFPDISFSDYVELMNAASLSAVQGSNGNMGFLTRKFVQFYFRDPASVLARSDEEYFSSDRYRSEMFDAHFMRTERLNQDLHQFLLDTGYPPDDIGFILELDRILPELPREGKARAFSRWQDYYTPPVKQLVRNQERHLFTLFPEFDL